MIVAGLLCGAFPPAAFSAVPESMSPRLVGVGIAILTLETVDLLSVVPGLPSPEQVPGV